MQLGSQYIADVIELNPYDKLAPFEWDVLLVHGTGDDLVDVRYSREAFARYREETEKRGLDRQVVLQEIAGGAHGFSEEHDVLAMGYVEKFLRGEEKEDGKYGYWGFTVRAQRRGKEHVGEGVGGKDGRPFH